MPSVIKVKNKKRQKTKRSASKRIDEYWDGKKCRLKVGKCINLSVRNTFVINCLKMTVMHDHSCLNYIILYIKRNHPVYLPLKEGCLNITVFIC